jgi:hypothetical protein
VLSVRRQEGGYRVAIEDAASPMREALVSVDAGEWRAATVEDGLLDGRRETLTVSVPAGARLALLRLVDAAFNGLTIDLLAEGK